MNTHGVTVGVLNGYRQSDDAARNPRSRGLLVKDLASALSVADAARRLAVCDPPRYRSFRLLVLDPERSLVAEWDGRRLVTGSAEDRVPLISSSFDESDVGRARRETFAAEVGEELTPERLAAFHRSHANGPSAYSVCMHRPDAGTQSFTRIAVDPGAVELVYHPGPPCETARETTVRLPRAERTHPQREFRST
ncbi:MAG: hypothetical protein HKN12_08910 [Gemmatimonadetes bacterium]|nr:hypothetical protein [Gemmatimonadota bacterium]